MVVQYFVREFFHHFNLVLNLLLLTDCPTEDSAALLQCLKKAPVEHFADPSKISEDCREKYPMLFFSARVDGTYIPDDPHSLLTSGNFNTEINVMLGVTSTEGYFVGKAIMPKSKDPDFNINDAKQYVVGVSTPGQYKAKFSFKGFLTLQGISWLQCQHSKQRWPFKVCLNPL